MLESAMIVLAAAYIALVILGHILLISAIYKCMMDGPWGSLFRSLPETFASWNLAIRRVVRVRVGVTRGTPRVT